MPSSMHHGGPPQLTVDQLRAAVLAGEVDTVIVAFTDMQGRLQGKRLHGHFFLEHVLEHGTEGCNYLLAVDVDMNTVDGYAMSSWERGYGDMFFEMDLTTLRRTPGHPALGHDPERPHLARRHAARSRSRRAPSSSTRSSAAEADGYAALRRHRARVHPLRGVLRAGLGPALPGPDRRQPLQRRLLDPRRQQGRAGAARDPQRDVRRRHERGVGQGRVQPRPARDRLPLRRRAAHLRQPLGLQDRRQGDRRPARPVAHLHGEVRRARGQLVPHPPVAARRPTARSSSPTTTATAGAASCSTSSWPGMLATMRELTYFYAPNINSYKRFAAGSFAPTAVAWGTDNRTCALRVVGHGAGPAGREPACPAATSTPTSRSRR